MSARRAVAIRRAEFVGAVMDAAPSRAQQLVTSGLIDRAADITELAHDLTDAALREMESELLERRRNIAEVRSLRSAAFEGIVRTIIDRLDPPRR